ncbi:hypothetical protein WA026_023673 [Henosepilachna vigintioctopunctata]|uniref:glutathione transferase n=1 Tax=Henosepilachna vigintioctopunctata TaxID=420089 RepID=A0AAW1U4Z4_9CUCU
MAPAYKVTYFPITALGEPIRFLLSYGGFEFEDCRIGPENWPQLKPSIGKYHYESDEQVKERIKGTLFSETLPYYLERLDKIAKDNNGYLAAGRLTWADLYFIALLDYMNQMAKTDIIVDHPNLLAVKNNVLSLPAIKTWIEKRPESTY